MTAARGPARGPGGRYQVTVRGPLGPAFRASIRPVRATSTQEVTVLRARLADDRDLADLVSALERRGCRVTSIAVTE